ncbi:hypothetical protein A5823_002848 [Enterococcus faecalis]|uniref:hypothetical protein n=1 Tax=Enterococcus faecalis TaxID=1351 RepID=UPI000A333CD8|nr:hypothetical protein [Enterococcus faecalis]OTP25092.1 hypothetical protein A5823_002848 [Enterococcus faecalis]
MNLFNKSYQLATTQEYIRYDFIQRRSVVTTDKKIIGGIFCPDINTKMLTEKQKESFAKYLGQALTRAKKIQAKRENMPVDISDVIKEEEKKVQRLSDPVRKGLKSSYISLLKKGAENSILTEKKAYYLISETFYSEKEIEEKTLILDERLQEFYQNLTEILEEGYAPKMMTGTELVQLLEANINSYSAKVNRFVKENPEYILTNKEGLTESEFEQVIRTFNEKEKKE